MKNHCPPSMVLDILPRSSARFSKPTLCLMAHFIFLKHEVTAFRCDHIRNLYIASNPRPFQERCPIKFKLFQGKVMETPLLSESQPEN